MSTILTIALKDLRLLTRDPLGLFFIIVFPVMMGVFMGLVMGGEGDSATERAGVKIAVIDEDQSAYSKEFVDSLRNNDQLELVDVNLEDAQNGVRRGWLAAVVHVPEGFGETAGVMWMTPPQVELAVDPSRTAESALLQGMLMQGAGELVQARFMDPESMRQLIRDQQEQLRAGFDGDNTQWLLLDAFFSAFDRVLTTLPGVFAGSVGTDGESGGAGMQLIDIQPLTIERQKSEQAQLYAKIRSPWDISFPSAIMWGVMGCVAGFAISLVRERKAGTLLRLQLSPLSSTHVLAGKATACGLAVAIEVILVILLGLFLGIQLARPDLLVLAIVSIAVCFVGLMMLMAVIGRTEEAVGGGGWAIIVIMCMFGGGMVPLAFMPKSMATFSNFSPVKWGILALEGAVWRDFTLAEMLFPCAVLIGIGVAAFALGAWRFSRISD